MLITLDIDGVLADTPSYHPWENGGRDRWLRDLPNLKKRWPNAIHDILHPSSWLPDNYKFALVSSRPPETTDDTLDWLTGKRNMDYEPPLVVCTGNKERKIHLLKLIRPLVHFDDDPRVFLESRKKTGGGLSQFHVVYVHHPSWDDWFTKTNTKPIPGITTWNEAKAIILGEL